MRTLGDDDAGNRADDRRLVLLRHAKSDYPEEVADHERPLAKRGRRAAPLVGRWLAESGYFPDAVVCSTARRARETWDLAAAALADTALADTALADTALGDTALGEVPPPVRYEPLVRYEPRVYEATVLGLLMLVREFDPAWRTALIVGHNPGLAELTLGLAGPGLEPPAAFPTGFVAVLRLPGAWADAAPGNARLARFAIPAKP